MGTVTKRRLAEKVAQKTGQTQVVTKQVVQLFFDELVNELAAGNRLEFRDFGVFEVVIRRPRTGRNPRTGERVAVPPKRVVTFKMGKSMRERITTISPEVQAPASSRPVSSGSAPS